MTEISVIIPTHNRRDSLRRTLAALAHQQYPTDRFEVIVSIDDSTDGTVEMLAEGTFPYTLRTVRSDGARGAAAARNFGAAAAQGRLLVFVDDDIEASPSLLAAHDCAHERGAHATTGYLRTTSAHARDFFQVTLRGWWEAMFSRMRRPGHRHTFRDVLTGNCAVDAGLFRRVGGFDEDLLCHEDYELGVRLLVAGAEIEFVEDAAAVHHECTTAHRCFVRKRHEGRADVQMVRKHPHLLAQLPLGAFDHYPPQVGLQIARRVFDHPKAASLLAAARTRSLGAYETARLRGRWRRRLEDLLTYWYWRGVRDVLPDFAAVREFRIDARERSRWQPSWIDVDLARGLANAMTMIDRRRPDGLTVSYGEQHVGEIDAVPGAERLKGAHLRAALARELAGHFVAALGRAGVVAVDGRLNPVTATGRLPVAALRL